MSITRQQALDCLASDDLIGIAMEADGVRRSLHPEATVSYTLESSLDSSLQLDTLRSHAQKSVALGATGLLLTEPEMLMHSLNEYVTLIATLKQEAAALRLYGFSAAHILTLAAASQATPRDVLARLRDAGLDSLANSIVIPDEDLRHRTAPQACTTTDWLSIHRTAHQLGLTTAATMVFGAGESIAHRLDHLTAVRHLQQETGGFHAFVPMPYQPMNGMSEGFAAEPTAVESLKMLAVCRLYLDNIANIQVSPASMGLKVLQMSFRFGANATGSALLQERFARPGGATEEELRRIIREAGFQPVHRDVLYRTMFLN